MMNPSEQMKLARNLIAAKDNTSGIHVLIPYLRSYPHDVEAMNLLGIAYYDSRLFTDAATTYMTMFTQAPTDFRAMYGVGVSMQRLGRLDEAEQWLAATLTIKPGFERAAKRLAQVRTAFEERRVSQPKKSGAPSPAVQPATPPRRPLTSLIIPQDSIELAEYKRASRKRARIDSMNEHWYGLPVFVRILQVGLGLAIVISFLIMVSR